MRIAVVPILLACCAMEVATALTLPVPIDGVEWVDADADVNVVIIAGTITMASSLEQRIAAVPLPRAVIAFGVCASTGGPYWDSYAVVPGWPDADLFVPGCPPPARVLWSSIARVAEEVRHAAR